MRSEKLKIGLLDASRQGARPRLTEVLASWRARARGREALAHLDDLERRDLGLTEADVWRETHKSPWQA